MSAVTAVATDRRFYSSVQKDAVTFLETAAESGGRRTLLEVDLAPGGGNAPHRHRTYAEHFEVVSGTLSVHLGDTVHRLGPGETAVAPIGALHQFTNDTGAPVVFRVELRPGHAGFERALQIGYGLATDGRTNRQGMPRNPLHLGLLLEMSDIEGVGIAKAIEPVAGVLARIARRRGVERELAARYCRV
jgi:quercetin dioxygenase-like cupin family protein